VIQIITPYLLAAGFGTLPVEIVDFTWLLLLKNIEKSGVLEINSVIVSH